jgi:hypothetical protein
MEATVPKPAAMAAQAIEPRSFRWPIPTPIVVAVLGVVLGSWLLPAFTRQWDDRQRAGEVKASVVAQIASTTGRALLDAHQASMAIEGARSSGRTIPPAGKEWSVANMEIRARLRAYFGAKAVEHWALVSQYVTSSLSVAYRGPDGAAVIPNPWVSRTMRSPQLELLFRKLLSGEDVFEGLEIAILSEAEKLTSSLLAMHVRGYSTTSRDFVADLFP